MAEGTNSGPTHLQNLLVVMNSLGQQVRHALIEACSASFAGAIAAVYLGLPDEDVGGEAVDRRLELPLLGASLWIEGVETQINVLHARCEQPNGIIEPDDFEQHRGPPD